MLRKVRDIALETPGITNVVSFDHSLVEPNLDTFVAAAAARW